VWPVLTAIRAKSQGNACLIGVDLQPQAQGEMPGCLVPKGMKNGQQSYEVHSQSKNMYGQFV
jgi:hypothetical protein